MANTQSKIDLLEEQNSKLIAEIDELRKENAKISELEKKIAEVKAENMIIEENARRDELLKQRISELGAKNADLENENFEVKFKYYEAMEEILKLTVKHKARIEESEKSRTDISAENAELGARVVKLEQDRDKLKKRIRIKEKS